MHAKGYRLTLFLIGCLLVNFGCRGTQPLSRFVQVRKDPTATVPDFEAPRQRLATTNPRAGALEPNDINGEKYSATSDPDSAIRVEITSDEKTNPSAKPTVARVSSTEANDRASTTASKTAATNEFRTHLPAVPSEPATAHLASNRPVTAKLDDRARPLPQTRTSDKPIRSMTPAPTANMMARDTELSTSESPAKTQVQLPEGASQAELLQAFRDSPPQVQEQAMRQLVAALARTADQTSQPGALDDALTESLNELPKLPAESKVPASVPPNRLASTETKQNVPTSERKTDSNAMAIEPKQTNAKAETVIAAVESAPSPAEREPSNLEPAVVQAVTSTSKAKQAIPSVVPVSASRSATDGALVEQAANASNPVASKFDPTQFSDKELYDALLQRLSQAPQGESDADRSRRLIMARHLMVLAGDPDGAVTTMGEMSEKEQEYLRHQLLGLWTIIDPEGHPVPARRFTTALPQLREATKFLAAATDSLEVRSLAFCTEIESYGQIKKFPGNRFEAGQQVILYCEIENFTVSSIESGFETHLQGSYDLYNSNNQKVVSQLLPADKQVSSNYLRDYFIAYQMFLPKQLEKGSYRLQLTMEDVAGKKYGQASIPLEIK